MKDSVDMASENSAKPEADFPLIQSRHRGPNLWTTLQKWILVLPTATEEQRTRRLSLQKELERVVAEFDDGKGLGDEGVRRTISWSWMPPSQCPNLLFSWFLPTATYCVPT